MKHATNTQFSDRHLILIDIENLAGCPSPDADEIETIVSTLRACIPGYDDDQRIVSCSHHAAATVAFSFQGSRQIWRSGRNGADEALLAVIEMEGVARRYSRVTICSGDGIFAGPAAALAAAGVEVTAVAVEGSISTRLRLAARHVVLVPHVGDLLAVEVAL